MFIILLIDKGLQHHYVYSKYMENFEGKRVDVMG